MNLITKEKRNPKVLKKVYFYLFLEVFSYLRGISALFSNISLNLKAAELKAAAPCSMRDLFICFGQNVDCLQNGFGYRSGKPDWTKQAYR